MTIYITYKSVRAGETIRDIDSIHELPNGLMFITALKAVRVIAKSEIDSIVVSFKL